MPDLIPCPRPSLSVLPDELSFFATSHSQEQGETAASVSAAEANTADESREHRAFFLNFAPSEGHPREENVEFGPSVSFSKPVFENKSLSEEEDEENDDKDCETNGVTDESRQRLLEQYQLQDEVIPEGASQTQKPLLHTTTREALEYRKYKPPKLVHVSGPRTTPIYSSPRKFKASSTATRRKEADFPEKMLDEMDAKHTELDVKDFLRHFCAGKNMTARQMKEVGNFSDLDTSEESRMYPVLVSNLMLYNSFNSFDPLSFDSAPCSTACCPWRNLPMSSRTPPIGLSPPIVT